MPATVVKKVAKDLNMPVKEIEVIWENAKKQAEEQGKGDNYAYIMAIFQNMISGLEKEKKKTK